MFANRFAVSRLLQGALFSTLIATASAQNVSPVFGIVPETILANELVEASFVATATDADAGSTLTFSIEEIGGKQFPTGTTLTPTSGADEVTFT